jgi:hypothetical protein
MGVFHVIPPCLVFMQISQFFETVFVSPIFCLSFVFAFFATESGSRGLKVAHSFEGDRLYVEGKFLVVPHRTSTIRFHLLAFYESGTYSLLTRPKDY